MFEFDWLDFNFRLKNRLMSAESICTISMGPLGTRLVSHNGGISEHCVYVAMAIVQSPVPHGDTSPELQLQCMLCGDNMRLATVYSVVVSNRSGI